MYFIKVILHFLLENENASKFVILWMNLIIGCGMVILKSEKCLTTQDLINKYGLCKDPRLKFSSASSMCVDLSFNHIPTVTF